MPLRITETNIPGVLVIATDRFADERGFFSETYNQRALEAHGVSARFIQDNHALTRKPGTLRGLHFQAPPAAQTKLVRVTSGSVIDVAVDIRASSPTFAQHTRVELSASNWQQLLVPAGFAHGYRTLEPDTEVLYKVDAPYTPDTEGGLRYNDPALNIDWGDPAIPTTLSERDQRWPTLDAFTSPFD